MSQRAGSARRPFLTPKAFLRSNSTSTGIYSRSSPVTGGRDASAGAAHRCRVLRACHLGPEPSEDPGQNHRAALGNTGRYSLRPGPCRNIVKAAKEISQTGDANHDRKKPNYRKHSHVFSPRCRLYFLASRPSCHCRFEKRARVTHRLRLSKHGNGVRDKICGQRRPAPLVVSEAAWKR